MEGLKAHHPWTGRCQESEFPAALRSCLGRAREAGVNKAEALGGAAEGSYEQEVAAVEENEEMEREDERGVTKRPDLNELNVPEWAEL